MYNVLLGVKNVLFDVIHDEKTKNNLQDLSLLRSSRSIAASILSGFWSPLVEYTFLQLYQCLEYLYRLNNCFLITQ